MAMSDTLVGLVPLYRREARKCKKAKAYFAAVVMQVAALEASLQAMCALYPAHVRKTSVYQRKKFRTKRNRSLEFSLYQLIEIAGELHWFPPKLVTWGGGRTDLRGFAHEIRGVRNSVHPAKRARDRAGAVKFTKKVYEVVYEVCDVANSWLLHWVEQRLLEHMKRDARKRKHSRKRKIARAAEAP